MRVLALCALLSTLCASAQDAGFNGAFAYVSDSGITAAIETTVADMGFIKRPFARKRLKETNPAYKKVTFTVGSQEIVVQYDARQPIKVPADGKAVPWTREDGKTFMVTAKVEGPTLTQTFKNEGSSRITVGHLRPFDPTGAGTQRRS